MEREEMDFDVVIVGAGPAGLAAACRLRQLAIKQGQELSVCVLEKAAEIGAHTLSGAVFEPRALNELFPDWQVRGAPLDTPVMRDDVYYFSSANKAVQVPNAFIPTPMHNTGNYVISLGKLCRWLGEQAEEIGVDIFPGFAVADVLFDEQGVVRGVVTTDMGRGKNGEPKDNFQPGMVLRAKYTVFAEGCRGHLGKQLIERYELDKAKEPQHYAIGIKELWEIPSEQHAPGLVVHGAGWPLHGEASGGSFLYHGHGNTVAVGLIIDLNYTNPWLSPFDEFQCFKHHPMIQSHLEGGKRISYGARAIAKGGWHALPKMSFPGGLLIGCDAGTLNFAKIKGTHTAMKSGMLAAESIFSSLSSNDTGGCDLQDYEEQLVGSWLGDELHASRNFGAAVHRFGLFAGYAFNWIDQNLFAGKLPVTIADSVADHQCLKPASQSKKIDYPKPDGLLSFDRLSSVFLSNTNHEEDQPVHLVIVDDDVPLQVNFKIYAAPEERYCPAGVYEYLEVVNGHRLQINAQNCLHCKSCDIKDPMQNICWVTPESGGPIYEGM